MGAIAIFIVVLIVLILVHEFGHFIVAKKSGIRVDEFGIGFPPKIFGKKIGETEYTLNALPIGGFVRIWGEDPNDEHFDSNSPDAARSFVQQPRYIQALVLVAGVSMNILLAYVLYTTALLIGLPTPAETLEEATYMRDVRTLITEIAPNSPAAEGLKPGDEIVRLSSGSATLLSDNDQPLTPEQIALFISSVSEGGEVIFSVVRNNTPTDVSISPKLGVIEAYPDRVAAGFSMSLIGLRAYPFYEAPIEGFWYTLRSLKNTLLGFKELLTGNVNLSDVAGPVGIVSLVGDAASLGFTWLLTFSATISLNLAVINLFPFPALDGGRLVFVAIESIIRRPLNPIVVNRINQVGIIALLLLMLVVTIHDVFKLF